MERVRPNISDELYAPFWQGTERGELRVQQCGDCSGHIWPARPICPYCQSNNLGWVSIGKRGTVYSYSISTRAFHPGFADRVPYALVLVDLDAGVRMLGNLCDTGLGQLRIGMPVEAVFEKVDDQVRLVQWRECRE